MVAPGVMFGQGFMSFVTYGTDNGTLPAMDVPIYVDVVDPVAGTKVNGTAYYGAVFGGAVGTATNLLVQAQVGGANVVKNFTTTGSGRIAGGAPVQIPGVPAGTAAAVQMRAWSASLGADYATALSTWLARTIPDARMGWSDGVVVLTLVNSTAPAPRMANNGNPAYAATSSTPGLTSFAVVTNVPEPSVVALAGLGLVGAFMIRRRK